MAPTPAHRNDPLALPTVPRPAPATHPWRNHFIVVLFALAITLPGLALVATWSRTTTGFENRPAAAWPTWPGPVERRSQFTTDIERAFGDRFGGRDFLVGLDHTAKAVVFGTSPVPNVLLGRDGWLYYKGDDGQAFNRVFRRIPAPTSPEIAAIADAITRRVHFLSKRKIGYLLAVVPDKYTIYPEYVPAALQPLSDVSPLDAVLAVLPADVRSHVLDLRPALLAAKHQRQVYFRTDSHWNASGAWIGYQEILAALQQNGVERSRQPLPPEKPDGYTSGDLAKMIGVTWYFVEPRVSLMAEPDERRCARSETGSLPVWNAPPQTFYCASAPLGTAMIYHDSMAHPLVAALSNDSLISRLSNDFRKSHWIKGRAWNLQELAATSPEVVIDEIVERSLPLLADTSFLEVDAPAAAVPSTR